MNASEQANALTAIAAAATVTQHAMRVPKAWRRALGRLRDACVARDQAPSVRRYLEPMKIARLVTVSELGALRLTAMGQAARLPSPRVERLLALAEEESPDEDPTYNEKNRYVIVQDFPNTHHVWLTVCEDLADAISTAEDIAVDDEAGYEIRCLVDLDTGDRYEPEIERKATVRFRGAIDDAARWGACPLCGAAVLGGVVDGVGFLPKVGPDHVRSCKNWQPTGAVETSRTKRKKARR